MRETLRIIIDLAERGDVGALASILTAGGSLPMSRRSRMLIRPDGAQHGTVGGGCLEAEIHAMALRSIRSRQAIMSRFTLTEARAGAEGLNCGGTVRMLIEPVGACEGAEVYRAALDALENDRESVLVTALSAPSGSPGFEDHGAFDVGIRGKGLVDRGGFRCGSGMLGAGAPPASPGVIEAARELLGSDRSELFAMEREPAGTPAPSGPYFLESVTAAPRLYLFGGGHVGRAVAGVAQAAGFRVTVIDDRPEFASPERFPGAERTLVRTMEDAFAGLQVDRGTFIVAVTRGHQHDERIIEQAVRTPARYIGMIGSRRKKSIMWKRLSDRGVSREALARVRTPVGLPIGADTPGEIAVSIVAEMIHVRRDRWSLQRVRAPESDSPEPARLSASAPRGRGDR